jgi:hypothetical protein
MSLRFIQGGYMSKLDDYCTGVELAVGEGCSVSVRYEPTKPSTSSEVTLTIFHNGANPAEMLTFTGRS